MKVLDLYCEGCKESPWPGILFPTADATIEACDSCGVYYELTCSGHFIPSDAVAAASFITYLKDLHGYELELDCEKEGLFFKNVDYEQGMNFYNNFKNHVESRLHPLVSTQFMEWREEKERKVDNFAKDINERIDQRFFGPMSKGEIEVEELGVRDENVRLWNLLKRTRKHRDLMLRNLRSQIIDNRVKGFMTTVQRNRDHIDNLHTEINKLERRKSELKSTIMMMGGEEYK